VSQADANVGERLRSIRETLGLTQREAAAKAGMRHQYLSSLENGRVANPSLDTLARLAAAYGMGVDELIGQGRSYTRRELPAGLRKLLADPEWGQHVTPSWVETLMRVRHEGRPLKTKQEFLEAYLALRRIFG